MTPNDTFAAMAIAPTFAPDLPPLESPIEALLAEALARRKVNDHDSVATLCGKILKLAPAYPPALILLGETCMRIGQLSEAVAMLSHAVALVPANVEAQNNLGAALGQSGRLADAEKAFRAAVRLAPNFGPGWLNLGAALRDLGRRDEALPCFQRATQLLPGNAEAHMQLGILLRDTGHPEIAISHLYRALSVNSDHAESLATLGVTLAQMGEPAQGAHYLAQALERDPNLAEAHCNLGLIQLDSGKAEEAAASIERALAIKPDDARFHNALGAVRQRQGMLVEAIVCFRTALALQPDFVTAHSNLIFTLDLDPATDAGAALAERRNWNERHALPLQPAIRPHANDTRISRRLRIGYVSGDFKQHSASDVLAPLVMGHTDNFEVFCYSEVRNPDRVTRRYKESAAKWCESYRLSDMAFADLIRNDQIDILVDLAGFTAGSRLLVFARKPAPIQVGLTLGSGMDAMDYVLSDKIHIPESDSCNYVEQVVRLPTYFAFLPPDEAAPISTLPARANGTITFGAFNRWTKVTERTINTWAQILVRLPSARLLLKDGAFDDAATRARVASAFAARGVAPERLEFRGKTNKPEHLAAMREADLHLDSFPQTGGVTSLESLWMGVPVVTLLGGRAQERGSAAILTTLGLDGFIADNEERYVATALRWAADLPALDGIRATLRDRLSTSIICDHPAYVAAAEAAYRAMWHRWCAEQAVPQIRLLRRA
jgi:predicted O-linked N-acetylglucosamine transferase (SPINDLY family)